jgi:hypothetical protein
MSLVVVSIVVVLARRRNAPLPVALPVAATGEVRGDRANEETWSK